MKKILLISLVSVLFTGCAQLQHSLQVSMLSPTERAKYDCVQFGHKTGTPEYFQCVQYTTANIRSANATRSLAPNPAPAMPQITTTNCRQIGSSMSCTTF